MTEQRQTYNDDFFKLWEEEIDNVEQHVYNTTEIVFERMRAIYTLVKNSNLPIDDPVVARYVCELKAYEEIAKKYTSCFFKFQQIFQNS